MQVNLVTIMHFGILIQQDLLSNIFVFFFFKACVMIRTILLIIKMNLLYDSFMFILTLVVKIARDAIWGKISMLTPIYCPDTKML